MRKTIFFIGLSWPPTTFIRRKLAALAKSGKFNIIVGITSPMYKTDTTYKIDRIKTIKLPHPDDPLIPRVLHLIINIGINIITSPSKTLKVLKISFQEPHNLRSILNTLLAYILISKQDFNLVHFEWAATAFKYKRLLELLGKPYTISARGRQFTIDPLLNEEYKSKLIDIINGSTKIHCVSKALSDLVKTFSHRANTVVIYNGIDTEIFRCEIEKSQSLKSINLIFIGSLIWRKSIDSALYIFHRFLSEGGRGTLHIVGDGPEKPRMFSTINNLNLNDNVIYHGKKTEEEVAEILKSMDVLILTSLAEGLANVILEAMATCTVPVATNVHGNPEAITHGEDGFLFPPLSISEPVKYLLQLYHDPDLLTKMKIKAREKVESMFTMEKMREGHIKFFMEAIE